MAESRRYAVPQIMRRSRARRAYLAVQKRDKAGRVYTGQDEVLVTMGMSSRQAEREMLLAAEQSGEKHDRIRIEAYEERDVVPFR